MTPKKKRDRCKDSCIVGVVVVGVVGAYRRWADGWEAEVEVKISRRRSKMCPGE